VWADPAPGTRVYVPTIHPTGGVEALIEVQNVGHEATRAVLWLWGPYSGFCEQAPGPRKHECSGLLMPGSSWFWRSGQLPVWATSGLVESWTECPREGVTRSDVPLAVEVLRTGPGDLTPATRVSAAYSGVSATTMGEYDPVFGGYGYYAPLVYAGFNGFTSWLHLQNAGDECTSVEVWFRPQDDCLRSRICEVLALAPGESYAFDATGCVSVGFLGSAWIRSSQPLAIVVDNAGKNVLMSYLSRPASSTRIQGGSQVAYGPLIYRESQGWDTIIQVQNQSGVVNAKVKVYFLDNSGDVITTLVDWICPRGSQSFFLPLVNNLPGNYIGAVRVESQDWWTPGDPPVPAPNISAVAELIKYEGPARAETLEAIAYNLFPEWQAYDWQLGDQADWNVKLIGVPSLFKRGAGITTELAIQNVVPVPGFTDFAIFIYDQNGLLDAVCHKLNAAQAEYINLDAWGYLNPGFKGSAVISATFWQHEVFGAIGDPRNVVGLAAVKVERSGTVQGIDIPGDESAGSEGFPIQDGFSFPGVQDGAAPCRGMP